MMGSCAWLWLKRPLPSSTDPIQDYGLASSQWPGITSRAATISSATNLPTKWPRDGKWMPMLQCIPTRGEPKSWAFWHRVHTSVRHRGWAPGSRSPRRMAMDPAQDGSRTMTKASVWRAEVLSIHRGTSSNICKSTEAQQLGWAHKHPPSGLRPGWYFVWTQVQCGLKAIVETLDISIHIWRHLKIFFWQIDMCHGHPVWASQVCPRWWKPMELIIRWPTGPSLSTPNPARLFLGSPFRVFMEIFVLFLNSEEETLAC